jgi:DNA-binding transcriptional LysR family regulator
LTHKRSASGEVNWDDVRYVLAVAESGSVSAAARALGVNHATVLRRIAAFEEAQGAPVFDRTAQGYAVPPERLRVIEAAREAAHAIEAVARHMRGQGGGPGAVRLTSTDSLCLTVLPSVVAELAAGDPPLAVELVVANTHLDLSRLAADVAVRPAIALPPDLTGEEAARMGFAVYMRAGGAAPGWLGLRGMLARSIPARWMEDVAEGAPITGGADSFNVLRELAAAGLGRTILPCVLGDGDSRLQRVAGLTPDISVPVWVASHVDLAQTRRMRLVRSRIVQALASHADRLSGQCAAHMAEPARASVR